MRGVLPRGRQVGVDPVVVGNPDASGAAVLVGGVDVRDQRRTELRRRLGYVEQEAPVLAGTIRENLLLATPDADERRMLQVLAAVNLVETNFNRNRAVSTAGAQGPMQFLPSTWRAYGMGGDIRDPHDAILGAANYLRASGGRDAYP